ncbi:MAG: hypothetical protein ACYC1M_13770 [Armatimonadota bacterium]
MLMYLDLHRLSSRTIMRRSCAIGLMLLSLWMLVVTHVQAQTAEWYQHPEGAYRMKLPSGWKLLPPNLERGVDIIAISESSEEMLICDRKSTDLTGLTPEQSLATFELSLKQNTKQQLSRTTIGGMPAVLASNYDTAKQIASYTLIVLYKQHSYQLGAAVSSKVVLPTPPEVVRDSWASIEWQGIFADTPTPDREAVGHSSEQEVGVIQLFTPTAEKTSDDVLWQEPALPNQSISLPAFSIDVNSLAWSANKLQPGSRAVLSAAQEAMRLLYGPMNSKQAYQFEAKWAPFYNQSTPECEAQIKAMTPLLGQMVVARSGFTQSARSFFRLLVQANIARVSGNTREATEALRLCRYAQTLMIGYQACMETLCRQLELAGDPQNPTKAQQGQNERFITELKAINKLAGLPEAPVKDRQQMMIASELHKEYLNNLSQCFTEARQEQATKVIQKGVVQPESLRRLLWTDTLQRLADDDLSRVETSLPVHRRNMMDDLNAQMLINWGREEALKVQRVMGLLQAASALQLHIPEDQLGDVEAEWASHVNAKLLVARNTAPISEWVHQLARKCSEYWSSHGTLPGASARLAHIELLRQSALTEPTGIQLGLSDVPISGLGSAGAQCWGADSPMMAVFDGAQGYQTGGVVKLARGVMSWSQSLYRSAQSAMENWNALPGRDPGLKRASELLAQSKCFEFAKLYAGEIADPSQEAEPNLARFEADLQQGKQLAEAYIQAEQRLETATQLDPGSQELPALRSTAQQLAASVVVNTPAKYYLSKLSVDAQQKLDQHMAAMNQALHAQMVQTLTKQGYNASAIRLSPAEACEAESIDCFTADAVTAFQRDQEKVSLYQLLQDARSAYFQAYESVSRYGGQHGCSAKSDSLSPMALPFAAALSTNLVKLFPINDQPLPLLLLGREEMGQSVDTASFKMPVSSDTGITNTQEQCRQLNRDIRLKLIPWLDAQAGSKPKIQLTASYFRKLQMVLERASRKLPNPGLLSLATQELERLTDGVSVEQLAVYLAPVLDKLSGNR